MRTDEIDLMELFEILTASFAERPPSRLNIADDSKDTCFHEPSAELLEPAPSLAALIGESDDLLASLARSFSNAGDAQLAEFTEQIRQALHDGTIVKRRQTDRPKRLLDYAYPVV